MTVNKEQQASLSAAMKVEQAAQAEVARITESRKSVTTRLESLRSEASAAIDKAAQKERQVANEIAAAIANGMSVEAMTQLESSLVEATRELVNVRRKGDEGTGLAAALEAQSEELARQLDSANEVLTKARQGVDAARRVILVDQWNAAADALAVIGAELLELLPERGFYTFKEMRLPVFNRPASYLGREELLERAGHPIRQLA